MKKYPHLTDMGVLHPEQIDRYSINSVDYVDVLRIVYDRPKGSVLPTTRTYKFPRVQKTVDKSGKQQAVMESDPVLRAAVEELKDVTGKKKSNQEVADRIREELDLLEEDVALRNEFVKSLLAKFQKI